MNKKSGNIAEVFCAKRGIPRASFVDSFLGGSLYPHARLIFPCLRLFSRGATKQEQNIVSDIGLASSMDEVEFILQRIPDYYGREWEFRNAIRLRVSSKRIRKKAKKLLNVEAQKKRKSARNTVRELPNEVEKFSTAGGASY